MGDAATDALATDGAPAYAAQSRATATVSLAAAAAAICACARGVPGR